MKVLIVSFAFPPSNVIGAVRVGKLARYLDRRGHDIRVLTTDIVEDRSLPLEIPREQVVYTDYREQCHGLDRMARWLRGRRAAPTGAPTEQSSPRPLDSSLWERLRRHYLALIHVPDPRADWLRTAIPAGRQLIEEAKPEIVFASAPPNTGLIVASRLARAYNLPWVADFRDLWVDNPYYDEPSWRKPVDAILERRVLKHAAGLVTVSPISADQLRRRHGKTATVVYNGYAEEDFPSHWPTEEAGETLTIGYLGSIYGGFRDPSALFAAIALLPDRLRARMNVEFFSDAEDAVLAAAAAHRMESIVVVKPRIPYREALERQMEADVLLLLQSSDDRDEGNLPAKLFEYLYARRPILFIGYKDGIGARLVIERGAGLVSSSPAEIRDQLERWLDDKRAGRLGTLDRSVARGLSRHDQYAKLERILMDILENRDRANCLQFAQARASARPVLPTGDDGA
ncbi:MAG: glycosyltransferase [Alphaproteobacteria bacterium]|nr:glycosyltransferase [Alphaproteobacteria bacterium]